MAGHVTQHLRSLAVVLFGVSLLTFGMMHLMPGDPAELIAAARYGEHVTPEVVARVRQAEGLDAPLPLQYLRWMGRVLRGDLGPSVVSRRPAVGEIAARLPATLELAVGGLLLSVMIGVPVGVFCAARKGLAADSVVKAAVIAGASLPNFWLGLLLILVFSLYLGWLPSFGGEGVRHLVLPALTLGVGMSAVVARITRASMIQVLSQTYIRTGRAKGLSETAVVWRHALRNALIPVFTIAGLQFGHLLEGAVIAEIVFGRPGVGRLLVRSIFARDFAVVQGCVLFFAGVFIAVHLVIDVSYTWLDPRIHHAGEA